MPTEHPKSTWLPNLIVAAAPAFSNRPFNPYTFLLYANIIRRGIRVHEFYLESPFARDVNIIHLHWPNSILGTRGTLSFLYKFGLLVGILAIQRARGIRVVWTVHNILPHEHHHKRLEGLFWALFLANVDSLIFLTETSRKIAYAAVPALQRKRWFIIPHGHYRDIHDFSLSRADARKQLDLPADKTILLSFGQVRPYKRLPDLLRAFSATDRSDVCLVFAGPVHAKDRRIADQLVDMARGDARIHLRFQYLGEDELSAYLIASNMVVLSHGAVLNSGAAMLSMSANRPCLAPGMGSLSELAETFGSKWLRTYEGLLDAAAISDAVDWAQTTTDDELVLDDYAWDGIAEATIAAYQETLSAGP